MSECPTCAEFHGESIPPYKLGVTSALYSIHIHINIIDTLFMWFIHWLICFIVYMTYMYSLVCVIIHLFICIYVYIYIYIKRLNNHGDFQTALCRGRVTWRFFSRSNLYRYHPLRWGGETTDTTHFVPGDQDVRCDFLMDTPRFHAKHM